MRLQSARWVIVLATLLVACNRTAIDWEYPVRLGDARDRVYDLLGPPSTKIDVAEIGTTIEMFPTSGVSVEFDGSGRARELHMSGEYHLAGWITSERRLVFGLHARSTRDDFARVLGQPHLSEPGEDTHTLTWRRTPYSVLAEFWVRDTTTEGKTIRAGSLRRMEVSAAQ